MFNTFTEEQKTVVYALIGQALEDAKSEKEDKMEDEMEDKMKHSDEIEGGNISTKNEKDDEDGN